MSYFKQNKLQAVIIGALLGFVQLSAFAQTVYRCEVAGRITYQEIPCAVDAYEQTLTLVYDEKTGMNLQAQFTGELADDLAIERRSRQQQAVMKRLRRSLQKLHQDYASERAALLLQRSELAEHPLYRNRHTNPVRQARFERKRRELGASIERLSVEFQLAKSGLKDRIKRVKATQ